MRSQLGVNYVYEVESVPPFLGIWEKTDQDVSTSADLSKLPSALLEALELAAEGLKVNDIEALIEEIWEVDRDTGNHLANLAKDFRYDLILTFICRARLQSSGAATSSDVV